MPDPVLYGEAVLAAAGASAIFVLALGRFRKPASATRMSIAVVAAIALGILAGCAVLQIYPGWPAASALARLVSIVLPAVIGIELVAAFPRVPQRFVWLLRFAIAAAAGRILLHGSVYLDGRSQEWTISRTNAALAISAGVLAAEWWTLNWLSRRAAPTSVSLALAAASLAAGLATMMAGYLRGGEAALPVVAALAGTSVALWTVTKRPNVDGAIGFGVVGLFGLLFVGRFFGGLTTATALTVLLAPVLCVATEIPRFRSRTPWIVGMLRLGFVAIPLMIVMADAKRDFDVKMGPLLDAKSVGP